MRLLADQRLSKRIPVLWPVTITHKAQHSHKARVLNACLSGLLIQTLQVLPVGEPVQLETHLGPGRSIRCRGHILREEPAPTKLYQFGQAYEHICYALRLDSFSEEDLARFQQLLLAMGEQVA